MSVDLIIEEARWEALDLAALAEAAVAATLRHLGHAPDDFELALLACDDARIATLNAEFRGKARPTNVLSWPAQDLAAAQAGGAPATPPAPDAFGPAELGDMALAYETCAAEADAAGKPLADHVTHLVVHGTLHLLGYDHVRDADATFMERLEVEILGTLGLSNPYEEQSEGATLHLEKGR